MAKLGKPVVADNRVTFDVEDDRKVLLRTLPLRTYNNNGVDAYTQPDRGRVRPLLFGTKSGIRPIQYDIHYPGSGPVPMGKYELIDCTDWPTGIKWMTYIDWYTDEQAAIARSVVRRVRIVGNTTEPPDTSADVDLAVGRFYVLHDMRPIVISQENNKLHFDIGGAVLTAVLGIGTGPIYGLASDPAGFCLDIAGKMNTAAGTADITCTFVETTQKIQIAKAAGTLSLRCATGADVQMGIWDVLGFDAAADKTGSLIYNADNVFSSQAYDQTIRVHAIGFKDDASGTYTGSASAAIEKAPDIARFILAAILKVPASAIDTASFVAARSGAGAKPCSLYIGYPRTVADVFAELETSGNMDLVLKGGIWYCLARDTSVPAGTPDLVDADFLSFEACYDPEDLYGTVTLTYNEAPDGGDPINPGGAHIGYQPGSRTEMGEVTDATVALRHGRPEQKTFASCLRDKADAAYPLAGSRLEAIAAQAQTKRRRFRFTTKGKCLQTPINGKIRLTRTKGLDATGALSNVLVRVVSKGDDWARWVSDIEAIEVI